MDRGAEEVSSTVVQCVRRELRKQQDNYIILVSMHLILHAVFNQCNGESISDPPSSGSATRYHFNVRVASVYIRPHKRAFSSEMIVSFLRKKQDSMIHQVLGPQQDIISMYMYM